jgi:hypothetical protein
MKLTTMTEEELSAVSLIEPGVYNFEVMKATDELSKSSGKEMIKLMLRMWDKNGSERIVFDYLLDSMPHKLKHFTDCTGLADKYTFGAMSAEDCIGRTGKLELVIQKGKQRPDGSGMYNDSNSVKDYVKVLSDDKKIAPPIPVASDDLNDDIPF